MLKSTKHSLIIFIDVENAKKYSIQSVKVLLNFLKKRQKEQHFFIVIMQQLIKKLQGLNIHASKQQFKT